MTRRLLMIGLLVPLLALPAVQSWAGDEGGGQRFGDGAATTSAKRMRARRVSRNARFRSGVTVQFGGGAGFQLQQRGDGSQIASFAVGGLNFGFGHFIEDWLAVLFRYNGSIAFPKDNFFTATSIAGIITPSAQFWPSDWLKIELGVGVGYHRVRTELDPEAKADWGVALLSAVYFRMWQNRAHTIQVGLNYTPIFVRDTLHSFSLSLIYQYL